MTSSNIPANQSPAVLRSALIAGLVCGAVASIPVLSLLNCACCAPAILSGLWAAFMVSREQARRGAPFSAAQGALAGLVTGLVFGVTAAIVGGFFDVTVGRPVSRALVEWLRDLPSVPAESRAMLDRALDNMGRFSIVRFILRLFVGTVVTTLFGTLGGLIGGAVFKAPRAAPPATTAPGPGQGPFGGGAI